MQTISKSKVEAMLKEIIETASDSLYNMSDNLETSEQADLTIYELEKIAKKYGFNIK